MSNNINNSSSPLVGDLGGAIFNIEQQLTAEVPALKYIDQDWGQMDFFERPPVKWPCALIDIQDANYLNNADHQQQTTATVVVRIFDLKLSNSSSQAPPNQKQNARKIWQLMQDVNRALHAVDFMPPFGMLTRTSMRRTKRRDGCYQTEIYYQLQFTDSTCVPVRPELPETTRPVITANVINP